MFLLDKIKYLISLINLKFTKYKYRKYLCNSSKSRDIKNYTGKDYTLKFSSKFDDRKKIVEEKIEKLVQKAQNNPYRLIRYIEKQGTAVYKIKNANKILNLINETEGFIPPKKGFKAAYLNAILNHKLSFNLKECFIMRDIEIDPYYAIYHFYGWFTFKAGFAGYEYEAQEKFKKLKLSSDKTEDIDNFSISDILDVKEAIRRDIEAINFVIRIARNKDGAKEAFEKMLKGTERVTL